MNLDEIYDDEMEKDIEQLFPRDISDESAVVLCDFLAELLLAADSRYLTKLRRYRQAHSPPVDSEYPWIKILSD